jgi:hypothetical protein
VSVNMRRGRRKQDALWDYFESTDEGISCKACHAIVSKQKTIDRLRTHNTGNKKDAHFFHRFLLHFLHFDIYMCSTVCISQLENENMFRYCVNKDFDQ